MTHARNYPVRIITSTAPIRICDNGGWTDTWFAGHGKVFNIAVQPCVEVQIGVFPREPGRDQIILFAEDYGERFPVHAGRSGSKQHTLLEAAIARIGVPRDCAIQATVHSEVPAGCSTGTSAAVTVALIGALNRLQAGRMSPHDVACTAHAVEVEMLGQQSGVQDQLCSAYGGINYIEIANYPLASVSPIRVPDTTWWELGRRLALVYLGKSHRSSSVHEKVIAELRNEGPDCQRLQDLRVTAEKSRDALHAADMAALGRAMLDNTAAQARLHPDLVSRDAQQVMDIAKAFGALGWKVNGAGGEGGSVTILGPALSYIKREMLRAVETANPLFKHIPIRLSRDGLRVWESAPTT
jgi:D-glycero-alpha-D-manno-heptose-7-phosphate kinase